MTFIDIHIALHEVFRNSRGRVAQRARKTLRTRCIELYSFKNTFSHFILFYRQIRSKFSRMFFCVLSLSFHRTCSLYLYIFSFVLFLVFTALFTCILIKIKSIWSSLHSTSGCYMQSRCINTFRDALRTRQREKQ